MSSVDRSSPQISHDSGRRGSAVGSLVGVGGRWPRSDASLASGGLGSGGSITQKR